VGKIIIKIFIAPNVFGLGEVAEHKSLIEKQKFK
jgi:hypothetical protein